MARTKKEETQDVVLPQEHESEKVGLFNDWIKSMDVVIADRTKEKNGIEHQILLGRIELQNIQESKVREQGAYEQKRRKEEAEFEQLKCAKMREIEKKLYAIEINEQSLVKRMSEVEIREANVKNLEDEKHKLSLDRLELEKIATKADTTLKDASSKLSLAEDKINKANAIKEKVDEETKRIKFLDDSLISREENIKKQIEYNESIKANIENVRKEIEPKIEKLENMKQEIDRKTKLANEKIEEINEKINEEKVLLNKISDERKAINSKLLELNQREEEIRRKELLSKK